MAQCRACGSIGARLCRRPAAETSKCQLLPKDSDACWPEHIAAAGLRHSRAPLHKSTQSTTSARINFDQHTYGDENFFERFRIEVGDLELPCVFGYLGAWVFAPD